MLCLSLVGKNFKFANPSERGKRTRSEGSSITCDGEIRSDETVSGRATRQGKHFAVEKLTFGLCLALDVQVFRLAQTGRFLNTRHRATLRYPLANDKIHLGNANLAFYFSRKGKICRQGGWLEVCFHGLDMTNQIPSVRVQILCFGLLLAFFSYVGWSTTRMNELEAKLARVEASQYALGRYTFDLGTAVTRTNDNYGLTGNQLVELLLESMKQDDMLRPVVYSSRGKVEFIQSKQSPHNQVWALSR